MKCPKCQNETPVQLNSTSYCIHCGVKLTDLKCCCCGNEHPSDLIFCPNTGKNITEETMRLKQEEEKNRRINEEFQKRWRQTKSARIRINIIYWTLAIISAVAGIVAVIIWQEKILWLGLVVCFTGISLTFFFGFRSVLYNERLENKIRNEIKKNQN